MKIINQYQYEFIRELYINVIPFGLRKYIDRYKNIGFPNYYLNSKVIFIHVPKAAGSSISMALYGRTIAHMTADFYQRSNANEFNSRFKFSVVRDPWERALSAYHFIKNGGTDMIGIENEKKYYKYNTFENFIEEYLLPSKLVKVDQVLRPQYPFVYSTKGNLLVDYVGRVERMEETEEFLKDILGDIKFPKLNVVSRDKHINEYTPKLINMVGDIYSKDINLFNYSR